MGNRNEAVSNIRRKLNEKDRTFAWLARTVQVPYKRVLAELKHESRPLTLELAIAAAVALGEDPAQVIGATAASHRRAA